MEELKKLRDQIEKLDEEIVKLLEDRFNLSLKVGKFKKEYNLPILDLKREKELSLNNASKLKNKEFVESYLNIFKTILEESKKLQK